MERKRPTTSRLTKVGLKYIVTVNGDSTQYNDFEVLSFRIDGLGGDDTITIDPRVTLPVTLSGGEGNDTLIASSGPSVLLGRQRKRPSSGQWRERRTGGR